jgi:hypothetical protein
MTEKISQEFSKIYLEQLFARAEEFFGDAPYIKEIIQVNSGQISGRVPESVEEAIEQENNRVEEEWLQNRAIRKNEWRERKFGRIVIDSLRGIDYFDYIGGYKSDIEISPVTQNKRVLTGYFLQHDTKPLVQAELEQSSLEGDIVIAGETFRLDPDAQILTVRIKYPAKDSEYSSLVVAHTLLPYRSELLSEAYKIFSDGSQSEVSREYSKNQDVGLYVMNEAIEALF